MSKNKPLLILFLSFSLFNSCQDILECVINRRPELSNKRLATGQVNNYYLEEIHAEIKNEPHDNSYDYYFYIDEDLPRGLSYYIDHRNIIIEGQPQASGIFTFDVRLEVEQFDDYCENELNDCDGLCEDVTSRTYKLVIR